jgi:hypothetical protein
MIRYHSFYPWHREGAYRHLMGPGDEDQLRAVKAFNRKFECHICCLLTDKQPMTCTRSLMLHQMSRN